MRSLLFSFILLGGISITASSVRAEQQRSGLLTRSVKVAAATYDYQVYVPAKIREQAKPPVIVFLHGIGQRGEGGFVPAQGGAHAMLRSYLEQIPAIVLLPQCRRGRYWHDTEMERMVLDSLRQTVAEFKADETRLYLTGVSMGGFGVWHMAAKHPGKFAALVPICGGSSLAVAGDRYTPVARGIGRTPVWVFHGADDPIVPVGESRGLVAALKAAGGNVRYNEYAGVGHNVWLNVLGEPDLMPWLLAQQLRS
jgi:predicted peptidase